MTEPAPPPDQDEPRRDERPGGERTLERSVEVDAPPDEVWKALTDAEALASWFPLEAEVQPGEGGRIRMGWGDLFEGTARIEIWEPPRRLRTTWEMGSAGLDGAEETVAGDQDDEPGQPPGESLAPPQQDAEGPARLVVDYLIEAGPGGTRLRLVHSGFGRGADWDDWFDGTRRGWDFQLCCLRHWLERHPGRGRRVVWARRRTALEIRQAWRRLLGPEGLAREGELLDLREGDAYRLRTAQGDRLSGQVEIQDPPNQMALVVRELGDALLRVNGEARQGAAELELFLSAWEADAGEIVGLEERWQRLLDELLPAS